MIQAKGTMPHDPADSATLTSPVPAPGKGGTYRFAFFGYNLFPANRRDCACPCLGRMMMISDLTSFGLGRQVRAASPLLSVCRRMKKGK
jgi:hypothetical protein